MPGRTNEISGLMIMGVAGGAVVLPIMGFLTDAYGLSTGMLTLLVCLLYIIFCSVIVFRKPLTSNK
jgi:fucose permease